MNIDNKSILLISGIRYSFGPRGPPWDGRNPYLRRYQPKDKINLKPAQTETKTIAK